MYVDWIPLYRNRISEVQSYDLFPTPFLIKREFDVRKGAKRGGSQE